VGEQVSIEGMALQSLAGRDVLERALALSVALRTAISIEGLTSSPTA
jgi:hypothetical protein